MPDFLWQSPRERIGWSSAPYSRTDTQTNIRRPPAMIRPKWTPAKFLLKISQYPFHWQEKFCMYFYYSLRAEWRVIQKIQTRGPEFLLLPHPIFCCHLCPQWKMTIWRIR